MSDSEKEEIGEEEEEEEKEEEEEGVEPDSTLPCTLGSMPVTRLRKKEQETLFLSRPVILPSWPLVHLYIMPGPPAGGGGGRGGGGGGFRTATNKPHFERAPSKNGAVGRFMRCCSSSVRFFPRGHPPLLGS
jgi:hypothetical protein